MPGILICLSLAILAVAGCTHVAPGRESRADVVIRPDAPPEYDVLVGQELEQAGRLSDALAAYQRAAAKDPESAFLQRKLAEMLARLNRLNEALDHAKRARELEPDDVPTRVFLGQIYRLKRQPEAAEEVLVTESGDPLNARAGALLYEVYLDSGRFEDALRVAQWMIESEPDSLRGRMALAKVYERMERPADAEKVLREILEQDPGNPRVYATLARSYRERGDREGEIAIYREILDRAPHHHTTLLALSDAQMAIDDLEGATTTLEEIEEYYPDDMHSVMRLGFLYYEAREFAEAAKRFERVSEADPEDYEVIFFLGLTQRRMGDSDAAMAAFERIPSEHRYYIDARMQIASILERRADYAGALAEIERAQAVEPSRELELYAATLRSKSGDFDGAVAYLKQLLVEQPDDDELLYNLGVVYGEAHRSEEAIHYMRLALEKNPDNAAALNYIGYTWAEQGVKLDEAEVMIARAVALRPEDGFIADSLGWVYYQRALPLIQSGRQKEAGAFIERALEELLRADELTGGDPVVSEHLGDTYLLMDEKELALDKFEEALRLEPREGEQPNLLDKLESLRRELH